jgi:D-alanyl-lipoteichoic acid acyltransferase DltB (MBOAT superfamily)
MYFSFHPGYTLILLGVTVFSYLTALGLERYRSKTVFVVGYVLTLLPLLVFKYSNFVMENVNSLLACVGLGEMKARFSWVIPLGISFFTFQTLGYLFDVYKEKIRAERNFLDYMLFVAFFPQVASGPISKASELLPQIKRERPFTPEMMSAGFKTLLWGYFLKAVFADRVAIYVDSVYQNYHYLSGADCFMGSVLYSLQIYGDFAGYSLMAVGVGRLFGFELINNFQRPYFSTSVTDFWRRWHISLSRWLKDYVYIPLGGSRRGEGRTYLNILITFLVSGLWHGANWTFIVWGAMHGVAQSVEKFFHWNGKDKKGWWKVWSVFVTFMVVNFAWIFFRMPTIGDACQFVARILTGASGDFVSAKNTDMALMAFGIMVVLFKEVCEELKLKRLPLVQSRYATVRWVAYLALVFSVVLFGVLDSSQFIYVNF